ncbi:MAG: thiamine pyrophosphate-binding protein, partial [Candidatus Cloacimonetes bacterium]|nr:thiamine pyrophosphate-binding protein [Candidatus Cloacimonadota bacterium]
MLNIAEYCGYIASLGVDFITGVPDSLLNDFCCYIEETLDPKRHIIAANEGNAIAIACGYHLATGGIPLVYMQNSGLGNAMNPLISLTHPEVYAIPMILLIGWRGDPAIKDHVQHKVQGALTPITLKNLEIPYFILDDDQEDAFHKTKLAYNTAQESSSPIALIVKKRVLERGEKDSGLKPSSDLPLNREEAISTILDLLPA